jgi:hypothetical protein
MAFSTSGKSLTSCPSLTLSLSGSASSMFSSDNVCQMASQPTPNVIERKRLVSISERFNPAKVVEYLQEISLPRVAPYLASHPAQLKSLVAGLISDPALLHSAMFSRRGVIVSSAVETLLATGDIGGHVLLEVIISDVDLLWGVVTTNNYPLMSLYNHATRTWKLRFHQFLVTRMEELSKHSMGNYVMVHVLSAYPQHQDDALMDAITQLMLEDLQTMCLNQYSGFVAVAWSQVVRPAVARQMASTFLLGSNADRVFYRLGMSSVGQSVLINIFRHLDGVSQGGEFTQLYGYVKGSRYADSIHLNLARPSA